MTKRFDFSSKDRITGIVKKVGYVELNDEEGQNAQLYFYGDIVSATWQSQWYEDDKCPQDIANFINQIDNEKNIDIYFNSGGGDVFAGIAICNILNRHKGKKTGYIDGLAASIASVILMACDEVHTNTGAQTMIHKPWSGCYGNALDFQNMIDQLNKCEESMLDIYMKKAKEGITREDIAALLAEEKWFNGSELQEVFDIVVEDAPAVNACASDFYKDYKHAPKDSIGIPIDGIVDAVMNRINEKKNQEKDEILNDLYLYGI